MSKNVILLDANSLAHRAYHGMKRGFMPVHNGMNVGMLYGFCSSVMGILSAFDISYFYATFDTKAPTFRHKLYPEYKGTRTKTPDDFYAQMPLVKEFLRKIGITVLEKDGLESDDLIGILAAQSDPLPVKIISSDMDFTQLVSDRVSLVRWSGNLQKSMIYGPKEVQARYGIRPDQMVDYKALVGDSSDNFPGAKGIGPKTAAHLIQTFGTLKSIYENMKNIKPKFAEKLLASRELVLLSRNLAKITQTHENYFFSNKKNVQINKENFLNFLKDYSFNSLYLKYKNKSNSLKSSNFDQNMSSIKNKKNDQFSLF